MIDKWEDYTYFGKITNIIILLVSSLALSIFLYYAIMVFIVLNFSWTGYIFATFLLLYSIGNLLFLFACFVEERRSFRTVEINNNSVFAEVFIGKKYYFPITSIKKIEPVKKNIFMKKMQLFEKKTGGITLFLNDGRYFHISPNMENLDHLKNRFSTEIERMLAFE